LKYEEKLSTEFKVGKIITNINTNSNDKQIITDSEGTPFSISSNLNTYQYNQTFKLLTEFKNIFTTNTSNINEANVTLCKIIMKLNYIDFKFNAPHKVSPHQK